MKKAYIINIQGLLWFFIILLMIPLTGKAQTKEKNQESVSGILADLTLNTKTSDISYPAFEKAKMAIIDILGNSMAGFNAPGISAIRQQEKLWGGKKEATVWFSGTQLPAPSVGFLNSSMAHALDFDDTHRPSKTHISSVTVPAAFCVGEITGASGQEILNAIVVGVEVANSIGVQYARYREHLKFLPTSIVGGFGATAIACRLMGLSKIQTMNAFGIFYSQASGNRQALLDRTLTKRIQPGIAVKAAIFSAFLAKRDITGPKNIFLSEAGLIRIYGCARESLPNASAFKKKQDEWAIEMMAFKKYASCGASHPAIESAIELSKEYELTLDDINSIELFGIFVGSGMVDVPWKEAENPHVWAQFCAPYEVVSAIKNKKFGPEEITNKRIEEDKEVDRMARRVVIKSKNEWEGDYPGGQTVRIQTKDGKTLTASHTPDEIWEPDAFSMTDIVNKFIKNSQFAGFCSESQARKIVQSVKNLQGKRNISKFIQKSLIFPKADK